MILTKNRIIILVLSAVFFIGALAQFGLASFWFDEGYSYMLFNYDFSEMLRRTSLDMHMPLYYLLLKLWSVLFGASEVSLRFFSTIGMFAAIGTVTYTVKKFANITTNSWLYVFAVLTTSPILLRYATEVRMYAWVAFAIALANLLLLQSTKSSSKLNWFMYSLAVTSVLYLHFYGFFLLVAHGLWLLRYKSESWNPIALTKAVGDLPREYWASLFGIILMYSLWLPNILKQFSNVQDGFWIGSLSVNSFISTITKFWLYLDSWRTVNWYALVGLVLIAILVYIFSRNYLRRLQDHQSPLRLFSLTFFTPFVCVSVLSLPPFSPIYNDRYFVMFAPFLLALFAIGLSTLTLNTVRQRVLIVSVAVITVFGYVNLIDNRNFNSDNVTTNKFEQLWDDLTPRLNSEDVIVARGDYLYLSGYYYSQAKTPEYRYLLHTPYELSKYGGSSVVYDRNDLLLYNLQNIDSTKVWLLDTPDSDTEIPSNWQLVSTEQYDFTQLAQYEIK